MKKKLTLIILNFCLLGLVKTLAADVIASIDLVNVNDDKVQVVIDPGKFTNEMVEFHLPKIIPGTYQNSNFGKFIVDFKALDKKGNELEFVKSGENTWKIEKGKKLDKITYWVNDTFDAENAKGVYPMEGTSNIANEVFFLNLHGYIGYFNDDKDVEYEIVIDSPAELKPYTTLPKKSSSATKDVFTAERYFIVTDNPVMYVKSDPLKLKLDNINIELAVYSPSGKHKASDFKETIENMMSAQKAFMGDVNETEQYGILLYLATQEEIGVFGGVLGALEHHTSTTVVFADSSSKDALEESITDVVSHEFFHTLTPLTVHSEEIQYFDYNEPILSKHLWMYEGNTEYFANLFQVNQELISEEDFLKRMAQKIERSQQFYNDTMSFTVMSKNAADEPYKTQYGNVYQKGALINMCIDIIMREKSNGEKGVLWMMKQLADKYGVDKPFKDNQLFNDIKEITYPEVDAFLNKYVVEGAAIPYNDYFNKVGIIPAKIDVDLPSLLMISSTQPFIAPDPANRAIKVSKTNAALERIGLKEGDTLLAINDLDLTEVFTNPSIGPKINELFVASFGWKEEQDVSFKVKRGEEELTLTGKVGKKPTVKVDGYGMDPASTNHQIEIREAWLKG